MKKILLLLVLGISDLSVNAQVNNANMFTGGDQRQVPIYTGARAVRQDFHPARKTTATNAYWYSFQEENYTTSAYTSITPVYNDSSLLVSVADGASTPFNWYILGLGTSFDPTSVDFLPANIVNPNVPATTFAIANTNAYSIDSIEIVGFYDRKPYNNYVDTLNIYVMAAGPSITGTVLASLQNVYFLTNIGIPDSTIHYADARYDSVTNTIISSVVPGIIKIQKILDSAAYADSTAQGLNDWFFRLPSTLNVPAGAKVVGWQQYKSGHAYAFNRDIDSANLWNTLTYELNGQGTFPSQKVNDYNSGLLMTSLGQYDISGNGTFIGGQQYLNNTYYYGAGANFDDPYFAFRVTCPTCIPFAVSQVKENVRGVNAYPDPASEELNITYTLNNTDDVSISITNMLGQVVASQKIANTVNGKATFNTAQLSSGTYIYSVRSGVSCITGHVVIAH